MTTIEMAKSPLKTGRDKAVEKTIANAKWLASQPEWDAARAYDVAKEAIEWCQLPADEERAAMETLRGALGV